MSKPIVETKVIGEHEYRFLPYGYDKWLKLQAELLSLGGPLVGAIIQVKMGGAVNLGPLIQATARELLGSINQGLLNRFYGCCDVNLGKDGATKWMNLDKEGARNVWAGQYFEGYKVTEWIISEAFVPFWTAVTTDEDGLWKRLDELVETEEEETEN